MATKTSAFPRRVIAPPQLADARARKSFAERLQCFGFTEGAARCIADATVDPSAARKFIGEPETPNFEVRRTPIGIVKGIPVEVWATRVMPDPRNPRTSPEKKHPFAVDPGTSDPSRRYAPIPDPRSADVPGAPELLVTIENPDHLAHAHSQAAAYIASHNDWEDSIRSQGVMEPIWLAATTYRHADGSKDAIAVTTVDGSSRLTAVHKILRDKSAEFLRIRSADVPYRGEDDGKLRGDLRRMIEWVDTEDLDESRSAVLRNVVVPAFIIVGFESERPGTTFHTAVKSLVALRHVDPPTPWGPGPEHESLADEVLDQLEVAGLITAVEGAYLRGSLTRDEASKANLSADPAIRAARIIDVFMKRDDAFKNAIRIAVTAQSTRKQSSPKLMKELAAALILRGLDMSPREAEQKRKYLIKAVPAAAERRGSTGVEWQATSKPHDQLMLEALDEVREAQAAGDDELGRATIELAVRAIHPLIANNALTGERDHSIQPDRRQPWQVIDAMRQSLRGVRQLGEVLLEHADGKKTFRAVDAAGNEVVGEDPSHPVRLSDDYLREEYPDPGKVPAPRSSGDQPRDIYNQRVHDFQTAIERLEIARDQIKACQEFGTSLAEKYGVDYRACEKWLDVIHSVAKDLAVWEKADIDYNGRRHGDDDEFSDDADDLAAVNAERMTMTKTKYDKAKANGKPRTNGKALRSATRRAKSANKPLKTDASTRAKAAKPSGKRLASAASNVTSSRPDLIVATRAKTQAERDARQAAKRKAPGRQATFEFDGQQCTDKDVKYRAWLDAKARGESLSDRDLQFTANVRGYVWNFKNGHVPLLSRDYRPRKTRSLAEIKAQYFEAVGATEADQAMLTATY